MTKRFKLKTQEIPESAVLSSVLQYLKHNQKVVWAERMNVGSHKLQNKNGGYRFVRYGFRGLSDVIGQLNDGRFLAVECKRRTGKLSPEQKAFLDTVNSNGGIGIVARNVDDVHQALEGRP